MYFIELLVKKFKNKPDISDNFDPLTEPKEDEENCEHIFMPIDSSGEILACRNCGLTVKRKDLKDINFFRHK